jgi:hypothetical protein
MILHQSDEFNLGVVRRQLDPMTGVLWVENSCNGAELCPL